MNIQEQIKKYIAKQPEPKRSDMQALHRIILQVMPACKLWFLDGKNSENKTVSNPNIGYGLHTIKYADGKTREFYQIGLSANKTGISAASNAKTVRKQPDGTVLVTDGPYIETKEHMGGFWILEAADMDEALAWARKGAIACDAAGEVRELLFFPDPNGATE